MIGEKVMLGFMDTSQGPIPRFTPLTEGEVAEWVPFPVFNNKKPYHPALVAELYAPGLPGDVELRGRGQAWHGYACARYGDWVILHHKADGKPEGGSPVVYGRPEHLGDFIAKRASITDLAYAGEWGADTDEIRIIPRGSLGAGMVVVEHAGKMNPVGLAANEGGSLYQQQERAEEIAREILHQLGYRPRGG